MNDEYFDVGFFSCETPIYVKIFIYLAINVKSLNK